MYRSLKWNTIPIAGVCIIANGIYYTATHSGFKRHTLRRIYMHSQVISDYRGLQKMTNLKLSPAFYACIYCWEEGVKIAGTGKTIYPGNWRFLPPNHPLRAHLSKLKFRGISQPACDPGMLVHRYIQSQLILCYRK
jgi:hypothetical protein